MTREVQQLAALLGVPYVTAPMEAEAQCAALCTAGHADAVITEDADAFLFGAPVVYRRLFTGGAFAEAYRAADIGAELGCDRVKLVLLALLLGSDYTMGVHGVGTFGWGLEAGTGGVVQGGDKKGMAWRGRAVGTRWTTACGLV